VRSPQSAAYASLRASPPAPLGEGRLEIALGPEGLAPPQSDLSSGRLRLLLRNRIEGEALFVLERTAWADDAATGLDVAFFERYRRLFGADAFRPGEGLSVQNVALLFTDLKGSTAMYEAIGDAAAYGRVRDHFAILREAIGGHGGGLVKTIGDAVMASFRSAEEAVRAGLAMHEGIARWNAERAKEPLLDGEHLRAGAGGEPGRGHGPHPARLGGRGGGPPAGPDPSPPRGPRPPPPGDRGELPPPAGLAHPGLRRGARPCPYPLSLLLCPIIRTNKSRWRDPLFSPRKEPAMDAPVSSTRRLLSLFSYAGLAVALAAGAAALFSGPGSRLDLWHWRTGLQILNWAGTIGMWAAFISLAGGLFSVFGAMRARTAAAFAGIALGFLVMSIPIEFRRAAQRVPPINEVTTDTEDPPQFLAILPLRKGAPNPPGYNARFAPLQKKAYPDIKPVSLPGTSQAAYERALAAAIGMGWNIVAADRAAGRIEAIATTSFFGFQDDVVIRVRQEGEGSRVDVRSKSRFGGNDRGVNAKRVRAYLKALGGKG
jgi:uncharacterized protein (DUF1499 family)